MSDNHIKKMIFYLDKNVIQYIRKPRENAPYDKLFGMIILSLENIIEIPYSDAHFRDLMKLEINFTNGRYVFKDLKYFQTLSKGFYYANVNGKIIFYHNTDVIKNFKHYIRNMSDKWNKLSQAHNIFNILPQNIKDENMVKVLESLKSMPFPNIFNLNQNGNNSFNNIENISFGDFLDKALKFSDTIISDKEAYKEQRNQTLKINELERENDSIEISKIKNLNELDEYIKSIKPFKQIGLFKSFKEMVEYFVSTLYKYQEATLLNKITTSYNLLDLLGVDKEKITDKNLLYNISNDSIHLFCSAYTDILISEDSGMLTKGKIIYELFNIKTKIYSISEFINKLKIDKVGNDELKFDLKDLFYD